jgi:histidine phosphotransferase ChpT
MATEIAALIASRICHDLISPIGAIGNGMELMALSSGQEQSSPELDLISQSVENANARIRFFRIGFEYPFGGSARGLVDTENDFFGR